jgi:hypothetical protein
MPALSLSTQSPWSAATPHIAKFTCAMTLPRVPHLSIISPEFSTLRAHVMHSRSPHTVCHFSAVAYDRELKVRAKRGNVKSVVSYFSFKRWKP